MYTGIYIVYWYNVTLCSGIHGLGYHVGMVWGGMVFRMVWGRNDVMYGMRDGWYKG